MPRFPEYASRTARIGGSVFEQYRSRMNAQGDRLVRLHIGDSYAPPPYDLPFARAFVAAHPTFNRYCDTFGILPLREALAAKVAEDNDLNVSPENVLVTCGATNALSACMQSLLDPGDEALVLSPFWPFTRGMVNMAGATVVELPFYTRLYQQPSTDIDAMLEAAVTKRTALLYLNSPNNPSGKVLSRDQLEKIAGFVKRHDLWLVSDEAYDGMVFDDHEHFSPGSFPGMLERTVSVFTFSKVFMFSGARVGYLVSSRPVVENLNKSLVHQLYSVSTVLQQMLIEPVRTRREWSSAYVEHVRLLRDRMVAGLAIDAGVPDGAYYLFFPVTEHLRGRDYQEIVSACLDAGVSVAPGGDFGRDFSQYIRVCFAGEPPERLDVAIERLNTVFPG